MMGDVVRIMPYRSFIRLTLSLCLLWSACLVAAEPLGEAEQALNYGNYDRAFDIFTRLSADGSPDAMLGLGRMYQAGHGVTKSHDMAMSWYAKAINIWNERARQNDPRAYASLGVLFDKGIAFKKDPARAGQYFRQAFDIAHAKALTGDSDSQHLTGVLYSSGKGTSRDIISGVQWLGQAGEGGNENAIKMLIHIYECGCRGLPKDARQAKYWRGRLNSVSNPLLHE